MECLVTKECVSVIGVGGAGRNTVQRIHIGNCIVVDVKKERTGETNADLAIWLDPACAEADFSSADWKSMGDSIANSDAVVMCAGLGGNTGTNIAPVVADWVKRQGKTVVAVVFEPFVFEGFTRKAVAEKGVARMKEIADCVICISNDKLKSVAGARQKLGDAFAFADDVVAKSVEMLSKSASQEAIAALAREMSANAIVKQVHNNTCFKA